MKFWKTLKTTGGNLASSLGTLDRRKRQTNMTTSPPNQSQQSVFNRGRRRSQHSGSISTVEECNNSIYEEFGSTTHHHELGTTFVELIKRPGTYLGVVVTDGHPRISQLVPGSWAQRSDVLCVGDHIVSVNGIPANTLSHEALTRTMDESDRIQLEVRYRLPPSQGHSQVGPRMRKVVQVTLRKDNGSFGLVIRGGHDEEPQRKRPFTVVYVTPQGATFLDGTIRPGDRVLAINGQALHATTLPQLQSLLYSQDAETVFTIEYDVMCEGPGRPSGPLLVEIRRDIGDILGFGLNRCGDSGHIFIESVKSASLAERCGALHVGDILLAVNTRPVSRLDVDSVTDLIRGDPSVASIVQLEVLPGSSMTTTRGGYQLHRSSLPSPSLRRHQNNAVTMTPHSTRSQRRTLTSRYQSLTEINQPPPPSSSKERKKFVTFTVDLQGEGGPLGLTLAAEGDADIPGPLFISGLVQGGLAERTRAIQLNDQLVEVNGHPVQGKSLNEVIPLLHAEEEDGVKLKLARLISIPEREFGFGGTIRRNSSSGGGVEHNSIYARKPPLPSPSPCRLTKSPLPSSSSSTCVSLLPPPPSSSSSSRSSPLSMKPVPTEVHKVILFKDNVYEDFGFSVSDGLYEKGIFVARVRAGGPADSPTSLLRPLDRILQINETRTHDFDCCLAVPLIAAAGDKIELLITRPSASCSQSTDCSDAEDNTQTLRGSGRESSNGSCSTMPWIDEDTLKKQTMS